MAGIRSRKPTSAARVRGLAQGKASPVFPLNSIVMRSIRKTAVMPFRAGKTLALTDSSPHLWFSP